MEKCFAAIDLGTNSCRLLITDSKGEILFKDIEPLRLGKGMSDKNCFTQEAFERGIEHFEKIAEILKKYNIAGCRYVATAGCRMASNSQEFLDEVFKKTGIKLEVIDAVEEAKLTLKGALSHVAGKSKYVLVIDIGGGSSEITLAKNDEKLDIIKTVSIPYGSKNSTEIFDLENYSEAGAMDLRQVVSEYVNRFEDSINYEKYRRYTSVVVVSSLGLRLCAFIKKDGTYDAEQMDGFEADIKNADECIKEIFEMSAEERKNSPYFGKRADMFVAPCIIFETIYGKLKFDKFRASVRSAKDGIIEELREEHGKVN